MKGNKKKEEITAIFGNYQLDGILKWGYVIIVCVSMIILFSLSLYITIYSDRKLVGIMALLFTLTMIQYKNRTWAYYILDNCWQKIKYGW